MLKASGLEEIKISTKSQEITLLAGIYSEAFVAVLNRSESLAALLHSHQAQEGPASDRHKLACTHFLIALDHHIAVVVLLRVGLRSPALALMRSIWEAYLRGLWAICCATDERVSEFLAGEKPPKLEKVYQDLRKDFSTKSADRLSYIESLHALHGKLDQYAHGGPIQVKNWMPGLALEASHTEAEMIGWLDFVDQVAMYSAFDLDLIAGSDGTKIDEIIKRWGNGELG